VPAVVVPVPRRSRGRPGGRAETRNGRKPGGPARSGAPKGRVRAAARVLIIEFGWRWADLLPNRG